MARTRNKQRDTIDVATHDLDMLLRPMSPVVVPLRVETPVVDTHVDRRLYNPGIVAIKKAVSRSQMPQRSVLSHDYADATRAYVCLRRAERREVLFAKKRTGKGARSRRRRNEYSSHRC